MLTNIFFIPASDNFLLSCERQRRACYFTPLDSQEPVLPMMLPIHLYVEPSGISYDPIEQQIYWNDIYRYIYRSSLNDSSPQFVHRSIGIPTGIAIDFVGRNIYFADYTENSIRVKAINNSYQVLLINVESPQGIALDISSR